MDATPNSDRTETRVASPAAAGAASPGVCVRDVRLLRTAQPVDGLDTVVCATVCLGRLVPAEVRVELSCAPEGDQRCEEVPARRMWSEQSYDNGSYAFETHFSSAELANTARLGVSVWPKATEPTPPEVERAPLARLVVRREEAGVHQDAAP